MRTTRAAVAVMAVALVASSAGATTARFEGDLHVRFIGRSDDGRRILLEAVLVAIADGTAGDAFALARKRVPPLADVPLLGALFRSRTDRRARFGSATDLFMILTPHIITDDQESSWPHPVAPARAAPLAPPPLAPSATALGGVFKVDRTFQRAALKATLKYEGTAQGGELAGQTVKGKVKLRFTGDRL